MAFLIYGNLPEDEIQNHQNSNAKRICIKKIVRFCWGKPDDYTPRGRITIQDTERGTIPIVGVEVRARNWFKSSKTHTNSNGQFRMPTKFTRGVNYNIIFQRHHFSVRQQKFLNRQAKLTANVNKKGIWNATIKKYTTSWFNATLFMAGYHYYYENIYGLRRPPKNTVFRPQMKISGRDKDHKDKKNGNHTAWRRTLGIGSEVKVWRNNRESDAIYSTTIHELAHASHWKMGRRDFRKCDTKVSESWALGVAWVLTHQKYPNHRGFTYEEADYTLIVPDLLDNSSSDGENRGFPRREGDHVENYSIREIEDALNGQRTWQGWEDNIRNKFVNHSEEHLDELFDLHE